MSSRILVADDIEANRKVLEAKLEAGFHIVLQARNGLEAIEIAETEQPEIILLDVMMPGLDGYETCRRLKAGALTGHIPVVMVTALSETEDRVIEVYISRLRKKLSGHDVTIRTARGLGYMLDAP